LFKGKQIVYNAVGTESIQTPIKCSLFVSVQPFSKIQKVNFMSHSCHSAPSWQKKTNVEMFANLLKKKNWNLPWSSVFRVSVVSRTVELYSRSLLGDDATRGHTWIWGSCRSSSDPLQLCQVGERCWTAMFRFLREAPWGSGLCWASPQGSRVVPKPLFCSWAVSLGSWSCWRWTFGPVWGPEPLDELFFSISLYLTSFIFATMSTSRPVPAAEDLSNPVRGSLAQEASRAWPGNRGKAWEAPHRPTDSAKSIMTVRCLPRIQIVKMLVDPPSGRGEEEEEEEDGEEFDQVPDRTQPALLLMMAMMVIMCDRAHTHVSFLSAKRRGRRPFQQYMPSKPVKYGLMSWVACDARFRYAWKICPWKKDSKTYTVCNGCTLAYCPTCADASGPSTPSVCECVCVSGCVSVSVYVCVYVCVLVCVCVWSCYSEFEVNLRIKLSAKV